MRDNKRRQISIPIIIFLLVFILKIITLLTSQSYLNPEMFEYETVANNILSGKGFCYNWLGSLHYLSGGPPLYIFLTAGIYFISQHSHLAMMIIQAVFGSLLCIVVFKIAQYLFGKKTALLAAGLTMLHPGIFYYDLKKLHPLSFDALLFSLIILFTIKLNKDRLIKDYLILGILLGLGLLERGSFLFWLPIVFFWIFLMAKKITSKIKNRITLTILVFLTMVLTTSPWWIRNYFRFNKFVSSQYNYALYLGNNPVASGSAYNAAGESVYGKLPQSIRNKVDSLPELEQNKYFRDMTVKFIKENPRKFIDLLFGKIFYFWWFSPQAGVLYPSLYLGIYKGYYSILLLFASAGLINLLSKERALCLMMASFFFAVTLVHALSYIEIRHRWAIEPIFLIYTANGIILSLNRIRKLKEA